MQKTSRKDLFDLFLQKLQKLSDRNLIFISIFIVPLLYLTNIDYNPDIYFMLNNGKLLLNQGFVTTEMFTVHQGFHITIEKWLYCLKPIK